jgi:Leucine-rich repeat (LRR) protein
MSSSATDTMSTTNADTINNEAESTKNSSAATPSTATNTANDDANDTATATANDDATSTATASISSHWKVGQTRVVDSAGYIGTLAYMGPVASAKQASSLYAGVIWDDVSRGKHDGSVVSRTTGHLVRHFSVDPAYHYPYHRTPTCASFVPVAKVRTGTALTPSSVLQKYVTTDSDELVAPDTVLPHSMRTSGGRNKPVYFLGELQIRSQQQVSNLDIVSLRNMGISTFSRADWITTATATTTATTTTTKNPTADSCDMIAAWREMDLAGNLLADWAVVADLVVTFRLTALSLAQNRLGNMNVPTVAAAAAAAAAAVPNEPPPSQWSWLSVPKPSLRKLNLHGTHITSIDTILQLGRAFPALQELCLAQCDLSSASMSSMSFSTAQATLPQGALAEAFPQLQLLDCSQCGLTEWNDQVRLWACLPALQRLSLDDNPIQSIGIVLEEEDKTSMDTAAKDTDDTDDNDSSLNVLKPSFERLHHLQLAGTQLQSWMDVEQLNALTQLVSLRLRKCPVLAPLGTGEARGLLIARLPALQYLNASPVTATERVEAEKRYVLQVHRQVLAATAAIADSEPLEEKRLEILSQHPQWERLMTKHKEAMSHSLGGAGSSMPGQEQHAHSLADTVLNVTIRSMAASSCTIDPLIRRLPSGLQVGRLKALCARHFGLDIDLQTLHFRMSTDAFPVAMDDDENTLAYYGVSDGAEILMNEQDVQQQEKQAEQELVDRMEQQELELNNFQERQKLQG